MKTEFLIIITKCGQAYQYNKCSVSLSHYSPIFGCWHWNMVYLMLLFQWMVIQCLQDKKIIIKVEHVRITKEVLMAYFMLDEGLMKATKQLQSNTVDGILVRSDPDISWKWVLKCYCYLISHFGCKHHVLVLQYTITTILVNWSYFIKRMRLTVSWNPCVWMCNSKIWSNQLIFLN